MKVGSLFSGIGGLDLGLERAGMEVVWQCEADAYCRAVLRKHWPDVPCYEDVRDITGDAPAVDLLCGGFPCQPVSFAGKGLAQADERWLWPEFARIIRALRPNYVLLENVPGLLARGVGDVFADLAASGYDAEWDCIPAASVGAPHLRNRVFIVGYADGIRRMGWRSALASGPGVGERPRVDVGATGNEVPHSAGRGRDERRHGNGQEAGNLQVSPGGGRGPVAHANGGGLEVSTQRDREPLEPGQPASLRNDAYGRRDDVADTPSEQHGGVQQPRLLSDARAAGDGGSEGVGGSSAGWWAAEPDVGRVADGVPGRVDRLRALGNAVVPQVAEIIGRAIMREAS